METSTFAQALLSIGLAIWIFYTKRSITHKFAEEMAEMRQQFRVEFEERKAHIKQEAEDISRLSVKKLELFQKIAELVYRTRNKSQKIVNEIDSRSEDLNELFNLQDELVEFLFRERFYLERLSCFTPVHSYKNLLVAFYAAASEFQVEADANKYSGDSRSKYDALDKGYNAVIYHIKKAGDPTLSLSQPDEPNR